MVYTIGHSTRSLEAFVNLLREHAIALVLDVRRFPASRRHPHFELEALAATLAGQGIAYRHEPDLGGRRTPRPDSPNTAWRSALFRGYADHMATPTFQAALARLIEDGAACPTAVLCAEAVPWRCHRQLIADALVARQAEVCHILGPGRTRPHTLLPHARVLPGGLVHYPGPPRDQREFFPPGTD